MSYSLVCAAAISLIVLATFPSTSGQNQFAGIAGDNKTCDSLSSDVCCNKSANLNCSLCQNAENDTLICRESCLQGIENNTCPVSPEPPTPMTCGNLSVDACCNSTMVSNCSLCQAGDNEKVCKTSCADGETDTCAVEPVNPTTQPPLTSTANGTTQSTSGPATTQPTSAPTTDAGKGGSGQSFDGASFVGGMILSFGLIAIIFFGLKFYKARKEQNYRTL